MFHIREECYPKFSLETQGYVFNSNSIYYEILFGYRSRPTESHKKLYNQLALLTHPDKCTLSNATQLFNLVSTYYTNNDTQSLQQMYDWWTKNESFDGYLVDVKEETVTEPIEDTPKELTIEDKKNLVNRWLTELWFVWYTDPNSTVLRDVYIPYDEYVRRYGEPIKN
jgi:hypothetical protein